MALPLVLSFTLRFLFSTVDLVYAALLDDPAAVAAIGFYIPFNAAYIAVWVGLSAGFTACLAQAMGRRDEARIQGLKRGMLRLIGVVIPTLSSVGIAAWFVVPLLGLEPGLERSFRIYGATMLTLMPITGFWSIYPDSIVKAHYDTRSTMMAGIWATATNIVLNTVFVFAFAWGIFGIAFATVLSRLTALGYAMRRARAHEAARGALVGDPRPTAWPGPIRSILRLSLPGGLTYALTAAEGSVVNELLASLPDPTTAIASYGVYHQLLMLACMPTVATSVAVIPYVARMVPEGHAVRVGHELRAALGLAAGFALLSTLPIAFVWPAEVAAFFVGKSDGAGVPGLAVLALRLLPAAALAAVPFLLLRPVFEALHQPRTGILLSVLRFGVLSAPLAVAGRYGAPALGGEPLVGILVGLVLAAAAASTGTALLARRRILTAAAHA
jgi:Na+-driven multidrug efflux pump